MSGATLSRIATGTHLDLLESSLRRLQDRIARREIEISTGLRVRVPSDDPLAAGRALSHQARVERVDQYLRNISLQAGELAGADGALGALGGLAGRAKDILLGQLSDTATTETRRNSAFEVAELVKEAVSVANGKFGGRYLFGGSDALRAPVELVGNYVSFSAGAVGKPEINLDTGISLPRSASGADAFGALSAEIRGRADLNPRVTDGTKLADLNGGAGVRLARVVISDGLGESATVDLSSAETIEDVRELLNDTGIVTATINAAQDGIDLTAAGGDITVVEVEGGHAAGDLGILSETGAGATLTGGDLDPSLRLTTPLADLLGGLGIDLSGFTLTNGVSTAGIALGAGDTVEDLLDALNGAGAHVLAAIGEDGATIDLRSTLSGARLSVAEGSGSTAQDLGLIVPFDETELDVLNGGMGVGEVKGDDLRIVQMNGNVITIDVEGARTIQDVIDLINSDAENPGTLIASVEPGQNRLRLDDSSGGAEDLRVESLNASFTAENLGIAQRVANPGAALVGGDLNPAGVQADSLFNALISLRDALAADDRATLSLVHRKLDAAFNRLLDTRAGVGARVQRLERAQQRLEDERLELHALLDDERSADLAESVAEFQREQTILEAAYSVTGRVLSLSLLDFLR